MYTKFYEANSTKLIIFLTGWGCDDAQISNMTETNKNYDILLCWDYSDLEFSHSVDFSKYNEIYLLTYSAGVYVAGLIKDKLPKVTKSVAINGNPLMFDKHFGIKAETIDIFKNLNLSNFIQFARNYVVNSDEELEFFLKHPSKRDFESSKTEIERLEAYYSTEIIPYDFDVAILSDSDKIFNPITQKEYFKDKYIVLENSAHNPFYRLQIFDDIFNFLNR